MTTEFERLFNEFMAALDERVRRIARESQTPPREAGADDILTVRDVARIKGVKPRTVYDWVREERIPYHRTPGGHIRFYRRHVERVLSESPHP